MESQKVFYSINCAANKRDDTIFMIKLSNLRKIKHIKFVEKERPQCYLLTGRGHRTALTVVWENQLQQAGPLSSGAGVVSRSVYYVLCILYMAPPARVWDPCYCLALHSGQQKLVFTNGLHQYLLKIILFHSFLLPRFSSLTSTRDLK